MSVILKDVLIGNAMKKQSGKFLVCIRWVGLALPFKQIFLVEFSCFTVDCDTKSTDVNIIKSSKG